MIVTTSNILLNVTPQSVNEGINPSFDAASITDPDFSTFYSSSDNNFLTVSFGNVQPITYVALTGLNIQGNKNFTSYCTVLDGGSAIARVYVSSNNAIVLSFPERSFSDLKVSIVNGKGDVPPRVSFIAAGNHLQIPNGGESAGYGRQFLNRNRKTVSSLNNLAAPTSYLTTKVVPKGTLKIPNVTRDFSETEWQTFLDFSDLNYFFIREQDPIPTIEGIMEVTSNNSAYLCFEPTGIKATAHAQTRALNNLSISFKVFTGL